MGASLTKKGRKALLARKVGMTQLYNDAGVIVPVTILQVGPCTVLQVKTEERDGYAALAVGFGDTAKPARRPQQGLFGRLHVRPKRVLREIPPVGPESVSRVPLVCEAGGHVGFAGAEEGVTILSRKQPGTSLVTRRALGAAGGGKAGGDEAGAGPAGVRILIKNESGTAVKEYPVPPGSSIEVGEGDTVADGDILAFVPVAGSSPEAVAPGMQIGVGIFRDAKTVDVRGVTKGRGFQGTIRRYGFNAGPKSHGSKNVREPGSTGMHTDPGRVHRGKRMPGHMGMVWTKIKNLAVYKVDEQADLLLVHGAVPGPSGGVVWVQESLGK